MSILETKVGNLRPRYLAKFDPLFKEITQFGGGADEDRYVTGKSFSSAYQFYTYGFFLGISIGKKVEILKADDTRDFWELVNWQPTELRDQLIACAIAKGDFDMFSTQFMDETEIQAAARNIRDTIESYANAGFDKVADSFQEDPSLRQDDQFFLRLLAGK